MQQSELANKMTDIVQDVSGLNSGPGGITLGGPKKKLEHEKSVRKKKQLQSNDIVQNYLNTLENPMPGEDHHIIDVNAPPALNHRAPRSERWQKHSAT